MHVVVDFDTCESHGQCMAAAPEVFELRADLALYLLDAHPPEALRGKIEEAVRQCPTQAIQLFDD